MMWRVVVALGLVGLSSGWAAGSAAEAGEPDAVRLPWKSVLRQAPDWFAGAAARELADSVLLHQLDVGGWPKNIEMGRALAPAERDALARGRSRREEATIDNGATVREIEFLARVAERQPGERFRDGAIRGIEFLLASQYPGGGWPQFPFRDGYHRHITFNDDAMIGVMRLLKRIGAGEAPFGFAEAGLRGRCRDAVDRGVGCILATQVRQGGVRTVWCAQHDRDTLKPAKARSYELASLSGAESAGIVAFLMEIGNPPGEVVEAVEGAVAWFRAHRVDGIRVERRRDTGLSKGFDTVVVADAAAPPLWGRFHDLETGRPFFCGRDGRPKASLAEIEDERRNGYSWYTDRPREVIDRLYPAWKRRVASGRVGP